MVEGIPATSFSYRNFVGSKPDTIEVCPVCFRRLPDKLKSKPGDIFTCQEASWKFDGKEWIVVRVDE